MSSLTQFWDSSVDFTIFPYRGGGGIIGVLDPDISITYLFLQKLSVKI